MENPSRIIGAFVCQKWDDGGSHYDVDRIDFDATAHVRHPIQ